MSSATNFITDSLLKVEDGVGGRGPEACWKWIIMTEPVSMHPAGFIQTASLCPVVTLTIDDPLDPPDTQGDDEADGVPRAAWPVGHGGGHHGGQGQHDDSAVKHLSDGVWKEKHFNRWSDWK